MHCIVGKLNKSANQFQAGEYQGFGVRLGVQYYDRKTKQKEWTNYSAVLFASQPAKIKFYQDVLVEGAIISVSGDTLKIDEYEGKYSLELMNATLGYTYTPESTGLSQGAPHQDKPKSDVQAMEDDFDQDLPF